MEPLTFGVEPEEKYVVFKTADFTRLASTDLEMIDLLAYRLPDAVVIRRQDIFAGPALHAYASSIAIAAKLVADEDAKGLLEIADYFHEQALRADEVIQKLPD